MTIRFNQLRENYPLLFDACELIYKDNNAGGVTPIWESYRANEEITYTMR